jgi:hypothetical protein
MVMRDGCRNRAGFRREIKNLDAQAGA